MTRKAIIITAIIAGAVAGGFGFNKLRLDNHGWHNIASIGYWVAKFNHTDLYAPDARVLKHGNPNLKEIAITIDDGPHPASCPEILDILKREGVHATFFTVGIKVKQRPDLVRRMVAEGNEVGNHTEDHLRLTTLRPDQMEKEITFADMNFYRATGRHLHLLRPPGMSFNDKVIDVVKRMGYVMVNWTDAAKDFISAGHPHAVSPDVVADRILDGIDDGGIVLIHDAPDTAQALPTIIERLRAKGYKFVTIVQMLADLPDPVHVKSVSGPFSEAELLRLEKADPVPKPQKVAQNSKPPGGAGPKWDTSVE